MVSKNSKVTLSYTRKFKAPNCNYTDGLITVNSDRDEFAEWSIVRDIAPDCVTLLSRLTELPYLFPYLYANIFLSGLDEYEMHIFLTFNPGLYIPNSAPCDTYMVTYMIL